MTLRWSLALLLGTAACSSPSPVAQRPSSPSASSSVSSTAPSDPETLLARLAEARASVDPNQLAKVVSEIIDPLVERCTDPRSAPELRTRVAEALAMTNDRRATPCVAIILRDLEAATKDASLVVRESSARAALEFVAAVRDPSFHDPIFAIAESETRSEGARRLRASLRAALVTTTTSADAPRLRAWIERPLPSPDADTFDDALSRQALALAALARCEDEASVPAILRVLLSPRKAALHPAAIAALAPIAVPATATLVKLLRGEDAELRSFSESHALDLVAADARTPKLLERAKKAHVISAAEALSALGRSEALIPVLETMDKADPTTKAALATTIPGFPPSALALTVFRKAVEGTGPDVELPSGARAIPALFRASLRFYDPKMIHWILQTAKSRTGKPERVDEARVVALEVATLLMHPEHTKLVLELAAITRVVDARRKLGSGAETVGRALTEECKLDAACYLGVAATPVTSDVTRLRATKAVVMQPSVGDAATNLMKLLPRLDDPALVATACDAMTTSFPYGAKNVADEVQALANRARERKLDPTSLELCAAKLRARSAR